MSSAPQQHPRLKSQQKPKPFHRIVEDNAKKYYNKFLKLVKNLLVNPDYFWISGCFFILAEIIVCYLAIHKVACKFSKKKKKKPLISAFGLTVRPSLL